MDHAVALVEAYLRVNGYFTVTEYSVVEELRRGRHRQATDLDVMAVRLPGAGRLVPRHGRRPRPSEEFYTPDPALDVLESCIDLVVGEVKESAAELNRGARDPAVIRAVIARFGACAPKDADRITMEVLRRGEATTPGGHRARLIAFGTRAPPEHHAYTVITLGHVVDFLQSHLRDHWDALRHVRSSNPAMGLLLVMEKARRGQTPG